MSVIGEQRARWSGLSARQRALAARVDRRHRPGRIRLVAGLDVGFPSGGRMARGAVAVLDAETLELVESALALRPVEMPYIPGLLAFREVPVLMEALAALRTRPDLLLCDGQGLAHPRRCGVACHLGVLTGLPAIGVGKSRLLGRHGEVPDERGGWVELIDAGEVVGAVVRSRPGVKPIHVSVGHRLDLAAAVDWVMRCTRGFRLPETTRMADALASGRC